MADHTSSQDFQSAGYLAPLTVLSPSEAADALSSFDSWVATLPDCRVSGDLRFRPHLHLPFVNALVHHPAIVSTVSAVLNTSNVLLWSSDFNVKEPGSGGYFAMHQDATYTGLSPADLGVTVWLALSDPVDEVSGCMTFVEGSHKRGQLPHVEGKDGCGCNERGEHNMLSRNQRVEGISEGSGAGREVVVSLRGGQASLHHFYLLHKSGPNRSSKPRIGLALRYIAASVRQTGLVREAVTLVCGNLEHDEFDLEPMLPLEGKVGIEQLERGRAAHRDSMRRERANYFDGTEAVKAYDDARKDVAA